MLSDRLKFIFVGFGRWFLKWVADSGITPNQVTCLGLVLVVTNCALYLVHHSNFFLGVGLSLSYTFDSLDGAIARRQDAVSKFGGYLDAVIDRYQELAAYVALAWVNGWWPVAFAVMTGSMLTSYNKARTALEMPIDNKGWPDLLDRPRRIWILCAALILDNTVPVPVALGGSLLYATLVCLAVLTHFTALQRFVRARRMLVAADGKGGVR